MKKILAAMTIMLIMPVSSHAFPIIQEGAQQFQFSFDYKDTNWDLEFMYGRFVTDELLLGALFTSTDNGESKWSIGLTMEHHFHLGTMTYPYVSALMLYEDYDTNDHVRFGPAAGLNHFLTDYLAIDLKARFLFSSNRNRSEDLELIGGLRVLF